MGGSTRTAFAARIKTPVDRFSVELEERSQLSRRLGTVADWKSDNPVAVTAKETRSCEK